MFICLCFRIDVDIDVVGDKETTTKKFPSQPFDIIYPVYTDRRTKPFILIWPCVITGKRMDNNYRRKGEFTVSTHQNCLWHTRIFGFYKCDQEMSFTNGLDVMSLIFKLRFKVLWTKPEIIKVRRVL